MSSRAAGPSPKSSAPPRTPPTGCRSFPTRKLVSVCRSRFGAKHFPFPVCVCVCAGRVLLHATDSLKYANTFFSSPVCPLLHFVYDSKKNYIYKSTGAFVFAERYFLRKSFRIDLNVEIWIFEKHVWEKRLRKTFRPSPLRELPVA